MKKISQLSCTLMKVTLATSLVGSVSATEWSDTSLSWRYGTSFREPVNPDNIAKNIVALTHASGYKYGTNFFNLDYLMSDKKDPLSATSSDGAREFYLVYRHTLDIGKVMQKDLKYGAIRGVGATAGLDLNIKRDAGYNSAKQMVVIGPTLMFDVPGFLEMSALYLFESNAPYNSYTNTSTPRYRYKPHPMLSVAWGLDTGVANLRFEGFALFIAPKGSDEFGNKTKTEINFDGQLMYDFGNLVGAKGLRVGLEYQYWRNKFGNNNSNPFFRGGAKASTPMVRLDYHF